MNPMRELGNVGLVRDENNGVSFGVEVVHEAHDLD